MITRDSEDVEQITDISDLFKQRKIKCLKFNHSLESSFQSQCYFEGYFMLSDKDYIEITTKRPKI